MITEITKYTLKNIPYILTCNNKKIMQHIESFELKKKKDFIAHLLQP